MHPRNYKTFKALGIFLWYPSEEWLKGAKDLCTLIEQEGLLNPHDAKAIRAFAADLASCDLFEIQETYVETFDRVRSLSLHLFEHVHGESRDRGQAMVDLAEMYKEQGFALAKSELPDYLPVFLEYLSALPVEEALEMLGDTAHVLAAIGKRLAERGSPYHVIFDSLVRLTGRQPEKVTQKMAPPPVNFVQLDKEWEDRPVDFMGAEPPKAGGCGGGGGGCGSGGCGGGKPKPLVDPVTEGARP